MILQALAALAGTATFHSVASLPGHGFTVSTAPDGSVTVAENGVPVLRYNYHLILPKGILARVAPADRIYAQPRSDYIHPLFGLDGEELTKDFPLDHPHHRGIYWAWPETGYGKEMGDLHALQRVFARPTGHIRLNRGPDHGEILAENRWMWEDRTAIAREEVNIRVYRLQPEGRFVDLVLRILALQDGVTLARRHKDLYGGLNIRLNSVADQHIVFHTDPPGAASRAAWGFLWGTFAGGKRTTAVIVLQHPANPDYPGDWVQYPELNWFQPTFPAANTRFALSKSKPLELRYRIWVRPGPMPGEDVLRRAWQLFAQGRPPE
ncbi:MAG: DUF6807 family protein [Chthonomonadales bacterium]